MDKEEERAPAPDSDECCRRISRAEAPWAKKRTAVRDRSGLLAHRLISSLSAPALVHREERNDILPPEPFCQGERKKFPHD
jgi:hypothetical protein